MSAPKAAAGDRFPLGVKSFLNGFAGEATMKWLENVTQFDSYDNLVDVGALVTNHTV